MGSSSPNFRGENEKCLKPPASEVFWSPQLVHVFLL